MAPFANLGNSAPPRPTAPRRAPSRRTASAGLEESRDHEGDREAASAEPCIAVCRGVKNGPRRTSKRKKKLIVERGGVVSRLLINGVYRRRLRAALAQLRPEPLLGCQPRNICFIFIATERVEEMSVRSGTGPGGARGSAAGQCCGEVPRATVRGSNPVQPPPPTDWFT